MLMGCLCLVRGAATAQCHMATSRQGATAKLRSTVVAMVTASFPFATTPCEPRHPLSVPSKRPRKQKDCAVTWEVAWEREHGYVVSISQKGVQVKGPSVQVEVIGGSRIPATRPEEKMASVQADLPGTTVRRVTELQVPCY